MSTRKNQFSNMLMTSEQSAEVEALLWSLHYSSLPFGSWSETSREI